MSENWAYQLSVKLDGLHLVNIRADSAEEFEVQLRWAVELREPILTACASLGATEKPQHPASAPTRGSAPIVPQGGAGREIGPIVLENVELKRGPKDGPPWKSPMYVLKWDGSSASTFDALNGKAAQGAWMSGSPCYLTVEPSPKNPKFQNLLSIRMASAS